MENEWLNLGETAELLGVHPSTVRNWADRGDLPAQRTPGGHRRFRRADVKARLTQDSAQDTGAQLIIQNMLGRARLELSDGVLKQAAWYQQLDEESKQRLREIGRQLLHVVMDYLSHADDQHYLQRAREIGHDYARLGRESGLTLVQTARAYLFFREFLAQSVYDMASATGAQGPTDWRGLRSQIITLTNEVLLALLAAAQAGEKATHGNTT